MGRIHFTVKGKGKFRDRWVPKDATTLDFLNACHDTIKRNRVDNNKAGTALSNLAAGVKSLRDYIQENKEASFNNKFESTRPRSIRLSPKKLFLRSSATIDPAMNSKTPLLQSQSTLGGRRHRNSSLLDASFTPGGPRGTNSFLEAGMSGMHQVTSNTPTGGDRQSQLDGGRRTSTFENRRRMAQREFSSRRDSPVMVKLLQEIIDAQDD